MVKLGYLILSMVEMNLVGQVNLFLLVMGWVVMLIHHSYAISIIKRNKLTRPTKFISTIERIRQPSLTIYTLGIDTIN